MSSFATEVQQRELTHGVLRRIYAYATVPAEMTVTRAECNACKIHLQEVLGLVPLSERRHVIFFGVELIPGPM